MKNIFTLSIILGFSILAACKKKNVTPTINEPPVQQECDLGLEGEYCDQEIRTKYYNTYRGDGFDNHGGTYSNWAIKFTKGDLGIIGLNFELLNHSNSRLLFTNAYLTSNTTFKIEPTLINDLIYSGNGTVNENSLTLTLREVSNNETYIFTFNNMIRQ